MLVPFTRRLSGWHWFVLVCTVTIFSVSIFALEKDANHPFYLSEIIRRLDSGQNIIFTKFGDGEYNCMRGSAGQNADNDRYHSWLGNSLKKALVNLSRKQNVFLGKWHTPDVYEYCNDIASENGVEIPWVHYHLIMNFDCCPLAGSFLWHSHMHDLVRVVQNSHRKKIMVCNKRNERLVRLFKADGYVKIPERNWSFQYDRWRRELERHIEPDCIILIAAGLCSKVLISDIVEKNDVTFLDLGSSFDLLASKINSRGWRHAYEDEVEYYKDVLPEDWDF